MRAYWYVTSPPVTKIVVYYHVLQTAGSLAVYDVVGTSTLLISHIYHTVSAPGHTVFSGNETMFYMDTWNDHVEGVIYTLSVTGA